MPERSTKSIRTPPRTSLISGGSRADCSPQARVIPRTAVLVYGTAGRSPSRRDDGPGSAFLAMWRSRVDRTSCSTGRCRTWDIGAPRNLAMATSGNRRGSGRLTGLGASPRTSISPGRGLPLLAASSTSLSARRAWTWSTPILLPDASREGKGADDAHGGRGLALGRPGRAVRPCAPGGSRTWPGTAAFATDRCAGGSDADSVSRVRDVGPRHSSRARTQGSSRSSTTSTCSATGTSVVPAITNQSRPWTLVLPESAGTA
jgi:hypothetical protein